MTLIRCRFCGDLVGKDGIVFRSCGCSDSWSVPYNTEEATMILTYDAAKTLAKTVYELRAEAKVLDGIQGLLPEAKLMKKVLLRQATSIDLIVNQAVSGAGDALTQEERDVIWLLIREGRSRLV